MFLFLFPEAAGEQICLESDMRRKTAFKSNDIMLIGNDLEKELGQRGICVWQRLGIILFVFGMGIAKEHNP